MGMATAIGSGGTSNSGFSALGPFGQVLQQVIPPTPAQNNVQRGTWDNLPQATTPLSSNAIHNCCAGLFKTP